MDQWSPITMKLRDTASFTFNGTIVKVTRSGKEWTVTASSEPGAMAIQAKNRRMGDRAPEPKAGDPFKSVTITEEKNAIRFMPLMPDRPVVIILNDPFTLFPQERNSGYFVIPSHVRIEFEDESILADVPTTNLSPTWFGTPEEGESCFALKTSMIADNGIHETFPGTQSGVTCFVSFVNRSRNPVTVETFSLPAEACAVRSVDGLAFADDTFIYCEQNGDMTIETRPRKMDGEALPVIAKARISRSEKIVRKGLQFLKQITGFQVG